MQTIDRSYGFMIELFQHNIELHMCHHFFFTQIPHYHLIDATKAIKKTLGKYYNFDNRHWLIALSKYARDCDYLIPQNDGSMRFHSYFNKYQ